MIQELQCDNESEYSGDTDDLMDSLEIGDHFAILAEPNNEEGVPYYILQCQREKFIVGEPFHCVWGNSFEIGDHVIEGLYFQNWGTRARNYVFLNNSLPAFVHSHLLKATKFPMIPLDHRVKGSDPIYNLPEEHQVLISQYI
jgi:hypothetical protein